MPLRSLAGVTMYILTTADSHMYPYYMYVYDNNKYCLQSDLLAFVCVCVCCVKQCSGFDIYKYGCECVLV